MYVVLLEILFEDFRVHNKKGILYFRIWTIDLTTWKLEPRLFPLNKDVHVETVSSHLVVPSENKKYPLVYMSARVSMYVFVSQRKGCSYILRLIIS